MPRRQTVECPKCLMSQGIYARRIVRHWLDDKLCPGSGIPLTKEGKPLHRYQSLHDEEVFKRRPFY